MLHSIGTRLASLLVYMVKTARSGGFIMQRDEGGKGDKSSILGGGRFSV